jgi:hypothetical protein
MVDELWDTDRISDFTWQTLAGQWNQRQLLELVMLHGFYRMTASFLNSIGVEREDGVPSWPTAE